MSQWVKEIDYLRGIAILAVIGVHVSGNFMKIPELNFLLIANVAVQIALRFAVPLFLFISGFVLVQKYYESFSISDFYWKRMKVTLLPYLFFSGVYIVIYGILKGWPGPAELLRKFALAESAEHLWFFRLIFEIYIFYPLFIRVYDRFELKGNERPLLMGALVVQVLTDLVILNLRGTSWFSFQRNLFPLLTFLQFIFFFYAGIYVGRNRYVLQTQIDQLLSENRWKIAFLVFFLTILNTVPVILGLSAFGEFSKIAPNYFVLAVCTQPLLFVAAFVLCYQAVKALNTPRPNWMSTALDELGKYSFGIFLIHVIVLGAAVRILEFMKIEPAAWLFYPLSFLITLLGSYVTVVLIHRTPLSMALIGISQKRPSTHPAKSPVSQETADSSSLTAQSSS